MMRFDASRLLVVDESGRPVGVITHTDMVKVLSQCDVWEKILNHLLVSNFMTRFVISASEKTSVSEAAKLMFDRNIGEMPVVDGSGKRVGIVTTHDLVGVYAQ